MGYHVAPVIGLQITDYCNARCEHCFNAYHVKDNSRRREIDVDATLRFLDKCVEDVYGRLPHIVISGGGEPTLHSQFRKLITGLSSRQMYFDVVTNATTWRRWIPPLLDSSNKPYLGRVFFSFFGSETTHNNMTRIPNFKKIIEALRYLKKQEVDRQLNVSIDKTNISDIPAIIDIMIREDVNCGCNFYPVYSTNFLRDNKRMLDNDDLALLRRYRDRLYGNVNFFIPQPFNTPEGRVSCEEIDGDKFTIDYEGNLCFCCALIGLSYNQNKKEVFGNIHNENIIGALIEREKIKLQWQETYIKSLESGEIQKCGSTKCEWCISKVFKKITPLDTSAGKAPQTVPTASEMT